MKQGQFITFEGLDGAGKSTQLHKLATHLSNLGLPVHITREPGGCALSERVRDLLLAPSATPVDAVAEMLLFAAARAQHMREVILPALEEGKIVLCDRFVHSSVAYQGYGRELGEQAVWRANESALYGFMPDVVLFFDMPWLMIAKRKQGHALDRMERESLAFYQRVYDGFAAMHAQGQMQRIDAMGTVDEVFSQVLAAITPSTPN